MVIGIINDLWLFMGYEEEHIALGSHEGLRKI
jgi:hypothetical protein